MKQACAFGLGVILVTQNPVDIDYKGLTNAGTWFIGKLQAERDKERVLSGLKGAIAEAGKSEKTDFSTLISKLGSRGFPPAQRTRTGRWSCTAGPRATCAAR
ncbi:MAG: hypothetical protein R2838_08615 [Caldilineaceae bacterium]